jgi:hypothetical protein
MPTEIPSGIPGKMWENSYKNHNKIHVTVKAVEAPLTSGSGFKLFEHAVGFMWDDLKTERTKIGELIMNRFPKLEITDYEPAPEPPVPEPKPDPPKWTPEEHFKPSDQYGWCDICGAYREDCAGKVKPKVKPKPKPVIATKPSEPKPRTPKKKTPPVQYSINGDAPFVDWSTTTTTSTKGTAKW